MGKISDAMERHKKERSIKVEPLPAPRPRRITPQDRESVLAKEICMLEECSPKVVVLSAPDSADAESIKLLRAQILFARRRERPRVLMVASTFPGEGKTFVATNLAVSIALGIDEHVLLVDGDLRCPQLHAMLGYTNSAGLHEYLVGREELEDLIIRTRIDKLSLLTAGNMPRNPSELLSSTLMEAFLEEAKARYPDRYIVIDSGPTQATAESSVLADYVDGIILVVIARRTPREAVKKTVNALGKEKILGVVFNGYERAYKNYHKYYKQYYGGK